MLADRLGLSRASVTALVDRLAASGYVFRGSDPRDRRSVRVELEPPTWQAFARVYRPLGERVQEATAHLTPGDRQVVTEALEVMVSAFDAACEGLRRTT